MVPNQESKEAIAQVPYCFCLKTFAYKSEISRSIVMVKLPVLPCPHVWPLSSHSITKATQNLQVVLFIDCLAFWCVFVMHYAAGSKKQVSITFTLLRTCRAFWALVIPDASIEKTETWFLDSNHKPRSRHQLR